MRVMILAAGRGERLKPLTDTIPKPLIPVRNKPLIVYHLENLRKHGFTEIVINLRYLGDKIKNYLGNGKKWGVDIDYSIESMPLEVGGGILAALPLLGKDPFLVVNGDIWTDFDFSDLKIPRGSLAHLVLVDNPEHNPKGDYALNKLGYLSKDNVSKTYTYSGISVLAPALFSQSSEGSAFRLATLFDKALKTEQLTGEYFQGAWTDVGTVERLEKLETSLPISVSAEKQL